MKFKIIRMLLCAAFIFNMTSCSTSSKSYIFKASISGNPKTLDPQCTLYDSSASVIANVFQGLFSYDAEGKLKKGMIDNYSVSDNGRVWTFQLKQGIMWSDGGEFTAECTADDFVFAFRRLFRPSTKSGRASEYFVIKNAEAINSGKITDLSQLGVKAIDTYTLEIVLEKTCTDFEALLALPPAMPCNEEFFESTEGRYGLAADCIASNSGYYVHTWSYDEWSDENNYFILRRNTENSASENAPASINYFIDPVNERKDFDEGVLQAYKGIGIEEITELCSDYSYTTHENEVWGIIFNLNSVFSGIDYRLALANNVSYDFESDIYTPYSGLIPDCVAVGENNYRDMAGEIAAVKSFAAASSVGNVTSARMIMPAETELRECIGDIMQNWQSECSFYCSITELEADDYTKRLASGDFEIALVKLSGEYNSPYAYLNDFLSGNQKNYSGFDSKKLTHIMESAISAKDTASAISYYKEAEQLIIDSAVFVPLCTEKQYVFYGEEAAGACYNPFSEVYCIKE